MADQQLVSAKYFPEGYQFDNTPAANEVPASYSGAARNQSSLNSVIGLAAGAIVLALAAKWMFQTATDAVAKETAKIENSVNAAVRRQQEIIQNVQHQQQIAVQNSIDQSRRLIESTRQASQFRR